jgi:hypothetical protein
VIEIYSVLEARSSKQDVNRAVLPLENLEADSLCLSQLLVVAGSLSLLVRL